MATNCIDCGGLLIQEEGLYGRKQSNSNYYFNIR